MINMPRRAVLLVVWLALGTASAAAQPPGRGDWSVVDRQPTGTRLIVELIGGEEIAGTLTASRTLDLVLTLAGGVSRPVPKSAIVEVRTGARVADSLRNGMAYGGVAGAAAMVALIAALLSTCDGTCDGPRLAVVLPVVALSAGAGIGAGAAVDADAAIRRPLVLYRAPSR